MSFPYLRACLAAASLLAALLLPTRGVAGSWPEWIEHPEEPFAIMATEVTVAQFRACVAAEECDEATVDPGCSYGQDDKLDHPVACVMHYGAEHFCRYAGGRLCWQSEWLAACRGTDGRAFPYGETFDLEACQAQSRTVTVEGRPRGTVAAGSLETCEGGLAGLYDMAGNVNEWIADCKGSYCKFRGGSYLSNDPVERFAACTGVCSGNQMTLQSSSVGFRCCRDRE